MEEGLTQPVCNDSASIQDIGSSNRPDTSHPVQSIPPPPKNNTYDLHASSIKFHSGICGWCYEPVPKSNDLWRAGGPMHGAIYCCESCIWDAYTASDLLTELANELAQENKM